MPKSLCLRIARTLGCIRLDKQLDLLLSAFQIDLAVCFVFPVVFPDHRKAEQIYIKMSGALIIASDDGNVMDFFGQSARFDCQLSGTLFQHVCCRRRLLCTVCQGRNDFFKNSIQLVLGLIGSRRQDHKQILIRQHNAELSEGAIRTEGSGCPAHPALKSVAVSPFFDVSFRISGGFDLLGAGKVKPFLFQQLPAFPASTV